MTTPTNTDPQKDKPNPEKSGAKEKMTAEKPTMIGGAVDMARNNIGDTLAYIILIGGLILSFFHSFIGGMIVGFVMGLYFSKKVFAMTNEFKDFISHEGIFHGFIVVASVAALAISAPGLCLGLFIGAIARPLFGKNISPEE